MENQGSSQGVVTVEVTDKKHQVGKRSLPVVHTGRCGRGLSNSLRCCNCTLRPQGMWGSGECTVVSLASVVPCQERYPHVSCFFTVMMMVKHVFFRFPSLLRFHFVFRAKSNTICFFASSPSPPATVADHLYGCDSQAMWTLSHIGLCYTQTINTTPQLQMHLCARACCRLQRIPRPP